MEGRGSVYPLFVLALLVSVGARGAVQASVSCTVKKAPAGSERPIDAVDWYGSPADVRGGVVCRGRVRRDLPERVFRFVTDDNEIQGVTVSGGAGTEQDLHFKDTLTVPPDGNFVRLEDIDFDGYADLGLLERYEPPGNRRWRYRQFNPATGMFRREPLALALVNPRIDRVARTIITHELDGASGRLFTHATLRWSGGTLVPVREEHREWDGGHYLRRVVENRDGMLVTVRETSEPEVVRVPFDSELWKVVERRVASFGPSLPHATILLLESRDVTGTGGTGEALHDGNLVIATGRTVAFRYRTDPPRYGTDADPRFLMGGLRVEDVTGDRLPEVIFDTGYQGASDYFAQYHVLRFDPARRSFRDVRRLGFERGGLGDVVWLNVDGTGVALTVDGIWKEAEGHYGAHLYKYEAHRWDATRQEFRRFFAGATVNRYKTVDDALKDVPNAVLPALRTALHAAISGSAGGRTTRLTVTHRAD